MAGEELTPEERIAELEAELAVNRDELAKEKKRSGDAYKLVRRNSGGTEELRGSIATLEKEIRELKNGGGPTRSTSSATLPGSLDPNDPEPDPEEDFVGWQRWNRREDQRIRNRDAQSRQLHDLQIFETEAVAAIKAKEPDYEDALKFIKDDYTEELRMTGELGFAARQLLADQNRAPLAKQRAAALGITEVEAAEQMIADGAWDYRRQYIVGDAFQRGTSPAEAALNLAKKRGWKGKTPATGNKSVDASLAELERRRNLGKGSQTTDDAAGGGEIAEEDRPYTHAELMKLKAENPAEFRRVINRKAEQMDEGKIPTNELDRLIAH